MSDVKKGTVKWFNNAKGYGFICPSEGGKDLFVHMNNILMIMTHNNFSHRT